MKKIANFVRHSGLMLLFVMLLMACCTGKEDKQQERQKEIQQKAEQINNNPTLLSEDKAKEMIDLYSQYIKDYPKDTICEYYLFQMHNIYANMKNCDSALYCLDRIINEYPNGTKVGAAYFFKGVVLKDVCHNTEMSVAAFNEYISRYPDNPHVADAERMIELDTMRNQLNVIKEFQKDSTQK